MAGDLAEIHYRLAVPLLDADQHVEVVTVVAPQMGRAHPLPEVGHRENF
jgi:hypothetical protein